VFSLSKKKKGVDENVFLRLRNEDRKDRKKEIVSRQRNPSEALIALSKKKMKKVFYFFSLCPYNAFVTER